jgi:hypothetical protein
MSYNISNFPEKKRLKGNIRIFLAKKKREEKESLFL